MRLQGGATWRRSRGLIATASSQVLQHAERAWRDVSAGVTYWRLVVLSNVRPRPRRVLCTAPRTH